MAAIHDIYHCTCLSCTVTFGQQLANLLETWSQVFNKLPEMTGLVYDVQSTTSNLKQLDILLCLGSQSKEAEKGATTQPVFTAAGRDAIVALSLKCNIILKALILIIQRAAERKDDEDEEEKKEVKLESKGRQEPNVANGNAEDEQKNEEGQNQAANSKLLLTGTMPNLDSIKTLGLLRTFKDQADWIDERVTCCTEQLGWINKSLVLHLQMGRLAQLQNSTPAQRENGAFETELIGRGMTSLLFQAHKKNTQRKAKKQEKDQRLQELREQRLARRRASHSSLLSAASSAASATTVVDEDKPASVNPAADKAGTCDTKTGTASPPITAPSPEQSTNPQPVAPINSVATITPALEYKGSFRNWHMGKPSTEPARPAKSPKLGCLQRLSLRLWPTRNQVKETFSDLTTNWYERIFGTDDLFLHDRESETLEAWVSTGKEPIKVPFGHRRLQMGLERCKPSKASKSKGSKKNGQVAVWPKNSTWQRFVGAGIVAHVFLDDVVQAANRLQARERVCLTFNEYETEDGKFMLVFFAIQPEKKPISFVTAAGDTTTFPFLIAKDWNNMKRLIFETSHNNHDKPGTYRHIYEGHYSILDTTNNTTIPPSTWTNIIQPGGSYKLDLWPAEAHPLRLFWSSAQNSGGHGPYPANYGPNGGLHTLRGPQAEKQARDERSLRLGERMPVVPRPSPPGLHPPYLHGPQAGVFPRPPGMPAPMPGLPRFMGPPPPRSGVHIVARDRRWRRPPSTTTASSYIDRDAMTESEKKELKFVDYIAEKEKLDKVTMGELLAQCTTMVDVGGDEGCLNGWAQSDYESDSDDDDDSSDGTSSTGTIEDD